MPQLWTYLGHVGRGAWAEHGRVMRRNGMERARKEGGWGELRGKISNELRSNGTLECMKCMEASKVKRQ